jgi:hypothetical protein
MRKRVRRDFWCSQLISMSYNYIKKWFANYYKVIKKFKIIKAKNIINFNELGAYIGYIGR